MNQNEINEANQSVSNPQIAPGMMPNSNNPNPSFVVKKNNKKIMTIAIIAIVVIGVFFILFNTKFGKEILSMAPSSKKEPEIIAIETSQKWGDKFATAFQESFFLNTEIEINGEVYEKFVPTEFEIVFVDFLFDGTPEMIVKYKDDATQDNYRIFALNNNEVSETKDFKNADFRMIYSIESKELKWYMYMPSANSRKYGSYTMMEKILNLTAKGADIKTSTDVEITTFNVNYITSDFRLNFYKGSKKTLSADFKAAVDKFNNANEEASASKQAIIDNYRDVNLEEKIDPNDLFKVGKYTLKYGTYFTEIDVYKEGKVVETKEEYITINKNGTITEGDRTFKFTVYGTSFTLENNMPIRVTDDNKFVYGQGTGREYKLKE